MVTVITKGLSLMKQVEVKLDRLKVNVDGEVDSDPKPL